MSHEFAAATVGAFAVALPGLSPQVANEIVPLLIGTPLFEVERELIVQTLARCNGNRTHSARLLGIPVRTLRNKIRLYLADGIDVPGYGA